MNKEQQDRSWQCLTKEAREEIKRKYKIAENDIDLFIQTLVLDDIFGHHNLTSDTEPEEMLMVSKKQVLTELCRAVNLQNDKEEDWIRAGEEIEFTLTQLFGNKCLPDEEHPKPKFEVGDEVIYNGEVCYIIETNDSRTQYRLHHEDGYSTWVFESELEPYTEPISQNPAGNCDSANLNSNCDNIWETRNLSKEIANCDKPEDKDLNYKALYNALCELESASTNVRKVLISI